ncbi:unnamed protein product [marine sediment metagenome]|uniref:HTH cro/C1-type domain-containing protein n=1 Tax=marine sediment metagenome TaxID=412755 RepID=X0X3Y8_9ZZZZ
MSNESNHAGREFSHAKFCAVTRGKLKDRGWQRDMAKAVERSPTSVCLWLAGLRVPGRSLWPAIAVYCGVEVEEITRKRRTK